MPKISVIMPVYNTSEEYLRAAIESILNQTYKDFEFLIINDGSKNNSEDIILSYKDSRISYIKNEQNLGLIKTLNKALNLSNGEYIARMDSDDISLPKRFEKQVEFLDTNPRIGILGTWFECFPRKRIMQMHAENKQIKECLLTQYNAMGHPTIMIRNSLVKELGVKYDEQALYVEDYALWLDLTEKTEFANLPEILLNYRIHKGGIGKSKTLQQNINCQKIMFQAQEKYFEKNASAVLNIAQKLSNSEKITSKDLQNIYDFVKIIREEMKQKGFDGEYEINRTFYKFALKQCKKDFLFFKLLYSKDTENFIKMKFSTKLLSSIS